MIHERDNLTPVPKLAVMPIKSDVFSERHDTLLVAGTIIMSFMVSVAIVYGVIMAINWAMS